MTISRGAHALATAALLLAAVTACADDGKQQPDRADQSRPEHAGLNRVDDAAAYGDRACFGGRVRHAPQVLRGPQ